MISLVPLQLGQVAPTIDPKAPLVQRISVKAISLKDAMLVGIVTGFALSLGTLIFNKVARRAGWK